MGLCKCPKKKVTQQFCFEHKVNVCEFCMVHDHQKCVVHPYLQWLEDSSYVPNCTLCQQVLAPEDCVRLMCYHIFHWRCLDHYAQSLPSNTAPAGYTCPDCQKQIFPPTNSQSPIAQFLRKVLAAAEWARIGLGHSIMDSQNMSLSEMGGEVQSVPQVVHSNSMGLASNSIPVAVNNVSHYLNSSNDYDPSINYASSRKHERHDSTSVPLLDVDEDKYGKKSPMEFLGRWFRSRKSAAGHRPVRLTYRRWIILIIIVIIGFFTILHYFLKYGRQSADSDLSLDPAFNPHIRISEE